MKSRITLLTTLLVAQLALAAMLYLADEPFGQSAPGGILVSIEGGSPDAVEIVDADGKSVRIVRDGKDWLLPDYFNAPADSLRLNGLMTSLSGLRPRHPAATSESAAKRFKVAEDDFKTRVSLMREGEMVGRIYAGDTAGYRRTYVRVDGEKAVFDSAIPSADLSAEAKDWINRDLYQIDRQAIEWIELGGLMLKREGEGEVFLAQDLPEDQLTRQDSIPRLLTQLTTLRFEEILGTEPKEHYGLDQAKAVFRIKLKDQKPVEIRATEYTLEPDAWVMKTSDRPFYVKLASYMGEPLTLLTPDKFVMKAAEAETPPEQ